MELIYEKEEEEMNGSAIERLIDRVSSGHVVPLDEIGLARAELAQLRKDARLGRLLRWYTNFLKAMGWKRFTVLRHGPFACWQNPISGEHDTIIEAMEHRAKKEGWEG